MSKNRGHTSLRCRSRNTCAMQEYDRLPPELRNWLSTAVLPWSSRSVNQAYNKATSRTRNTTEALAELDRIQDRLIAKDAAKVWGREHPGTTMPIDPSDSIAGAGDTYRSKHLSRRSANL